MTSKVITKMLSRAIVALSTALLLGQCCASMNAGSATLSNNCRKKGRTRTAKKRMAPAAPPTKLFLPLLEERVAELEAVRREDFQKSLEETKRKVAEKQNRDIQEGKAKKALADRLQSETGKKPRNIKTFVKWSAAILALVTVSLTRDYDYASSKAPTPTAQTTRPEIPEVPKTRTSQTVVIPVPTGHDQYKKVIMETKDLPILGDALNFDPELVDWELFLSDNIAELEELGNAAPKTLQTLKQTHAAIQQHNQYLDAIEEYDQYKADIDFLWDFNILPKGVNEWQDLTIEMWRHHYGDIQRNIENEMLKQQRVAQKQKRRHDTGKGFNSKRKPKRESQSKHGRSTH